MKFFVTGVGGQLGHDVMNELLKRGHEGVGSDIQENYSGVSDGSAVACSGRSRGERESAAATTIQPGGTEPISTLPLFV